MRTVTTKTQRLHESSLKICRMFSLYKAPSWGMKSFGCVHLLVSSFPYRNTEELLVLLCVNTTTWCIAHLPHRWTWITPSKRHVVPWEIWDRRLIIDRDTRESRKVQNRESTHPGARCTEQIGSDQAGTTSGTAGVKQSAAWTPEDGI